MPAYVVPPRARNAAATKEAILAAARRRFFEEGYDTVGLREIARDAGVDVALVGRYFGSKEELFHEVIRGGGEARTFDISAAHGDIPAYLAGLLTEDGTDHEAETARLIMILRSASSPSAAAVVNMALREDVLQPIGELLEGDNAELRASLAMAVVIGATVLRTIMSVGPISEYKRHLIRRKLESIIAAALEDDCGPIGQAEDGTPL